MGLNKGETLHSMAREISFGHQGRFTDRGYEAQLNRASALSLIINAIVVWNTRHFDRAQSKLLEQGCPVDEMVWQHLSPLAWKHINLVGSYHFTEVSLQEEFRPLRESERVSRRLSTAFPKETDTSSRMPNTAASSLREFPVQLSLLQTSERSGVHEEDETQSFPDEDRK